MPPLGPPRRSKSSNSGREWQVQRGITAATRGRQLQEHLQASLRTGPGRRGQAAGVVLGRRLENPLDRSCLRRCRPTAPDRCSQRSGDTRPAASRLRRRSASRPAPRRTASGRVGGRELPGDHGRSRYAARSRAARALPERPAEDAATGQQADPPVHRRLPGCRLSPAPRRLGPRQNTTGARASGLLAVSPRFPRGRCRFRESSTRPRRNCSARRR